MDLRNTIVDTSLDLNINSYGTSSVFKLYNTDPRDEAGKHGVHHHHVDDNMRAEPAFEHEDALRVQEIKRIRSENQKLNEALSLLTEKYNALRSHVMEPESHGIPENEAMTMTTLASRKRKLEDTDFSNMIKIYENGNACFSGQEFWKKPKESIIKPNVSKYLVRADASDTSLVVKDGYVWRKYGQKVTRDNPSPRAYFKCSFAPNCPVKKKVQRSVDNPSFLVAIYEGEHNHMRPCEAQLSPNVPKVSNMHSLPFIAPERPSTSKSNSSHDMLHQSPRPACTSPPKQDSTGHAPPPPPPLPQLLVQQMALSLTNDPNFTAALIEAISGKVLEEAGTGTW